MYSLSVQQVLIEGSLVLRPWETLGTQGKLESPSICPAGLMFYLWDMHSNWETYPYVSVFLCLCLYRRKFHSVFRDTADYSKARA